MDKHRKVFFTTDRLLAVEYDLSLVASTRSMSVEQSNRDFLSDEVFETDDDARKTIELLMNAYAGDDGPFVWPLILRENGEHIGHIEAAGLGKGAWEIGYHIGERFQGRGYASESVYAGTPYIIARLGIDQLSGVCKASNLPSGRVLEKCGYTLESEGIGCYLGEQVPVRRYVYTKKNVRERIVYRDITPDEAELPLFDGFDRHQEVRRCWRKEDGEWILRDIAFTEEWDDSNYTGVAEDMKKTIASGGRVYGAFDSGRLLGFSTVESKPLGSRGQYRQLECMQVTCGYRGLGIGRVLFSMAAHGARELGAEKLYISGHSSEESQAFYHAVGCVEAEEYDAGLVALEPCDCQLEYKL